MRAEPMGKLLMLREADAERIETLKKRLGARTKIDVVRSALDLLERDAERSARIAQWRKAAKLAANQSRKVSRAFRRHTRLARLD
jgi:16S rRNA U1498 N3-methylase RsmE